MSVSFNTLLAKPAVYSIRATM